MNETLIAISCDKCQSRFRVKPNIFKFMKTLRCSKCGNSIPLARFAAEASARAPAPSAGTAEQPVPVAPAEEPAPVAPAPEPAPEAAVTQPVPEAAATPPAPAEQPPVAAPSLQKEFDTLQSRVRALEAELAESDARVAELQILWQSKEIEVREMAERMHRAEKNAREALAARDAFLARIKDELALHLVRERDASLTRFAELERKLLSLAPPAP